TRLPSVRSRPDSLVSSPRLMIFLLFTRSGMAADGTAVLSTDYADLHRLGIHVAEICENLRNLWTTYLSFLCGRRWVTPISTDHFHAAPTTHCNAPGSNSKVAGSLLISSPSTLNHIPGRDLIAIFLARRKTIASEFRCFPTRI